MKTNLEQWKINIEQWRTNIGQWKATPWLWKTTIGHCKTNIEQWKTDVEQNKTKKTWTIGHLGWTKNGGRTSDDELARSSQWVATYTRGRLTCTYHIIFEIYIGQMKNYHWIMEIHYLLPPLLPADMEFVTGTTGMHV